MVTRKKEPGLNMLNITFPFMIFFIAIVIFYYVILWDNLKLAQEELHNGLQMTESMVIAGSTGAKTERDRTHIVWSTQKNVGTDTYSYDASSPILDGTLLKVKNNYIDALNTVFDLKDQKPQSGAITVLSSSKKICTKEFFIIEKIYYRNDDKNVTESLRGKFKEYVVYDYDTSNNTISVPSAAITGEAANPYLRKVGGISASYNDADAITGSTLYVTIEYKDLDTDTSKALRNPLANHYKAISDVSVTEVMDVVLQINDER